MKYLLIFTEGPSYETKTYYQEFDNKTELEEFVNEQQNPRYQGCEFDVEAIYEIHDKLELVPVKTVIEYKFKD
jgi:hypothetical protein